MAKTPDERIKPILALQQNNDEEIVDSSETANDGITTKSVKTKKGKWYHSSYISKILDNTATAFSTIGKAAKKLGSQFPTLKFATTIVAGSAKIVASSCSFASIVTNPKGELEEDAEKRKRLKDIEWYNKVSSAFGALSGAAILVAVFAPITAPIALLVAACTTLISSISETFGEIAKFKNNTENSKNNNSKLLIRAHISKIAATGCSALSSGLFAASLAAVFIFPPAAPILLLASVIVSGISCIFKAASSVFNAIFKKKNSKPDFEVVPQSKLKHKHKNFKPSFKQKNKPRKTLREKLVNRKALFKKRLLLIAKNKKNVLPINQPPPRPNPKPTDHDK